MNILHSTLLFLMMIGAVIGLVGIASLFITFTDDPDDWGI